MAAKQKILIVDDDNNIAELISLYLTKECFDTMIVNDGEEALKAFASFGPNLILLDLMLPGMDGYQVCREIRHKSNVPIIMLSAKGEIFDKVLGLELGADDYMIKPFDSKELVARVKAVLRRYQPTVAPGNQPSGKYVEYPDLAINLTNYSVVYYGKQVDMPPKELELLYFLAASPNQVFTREQLLDHIWGYEYIGDTRTVDVHIKRLREKIKDHPPGPSAPYGVLVINSRSKTDEKIALYQVCGILPDSGVYRILRGFHDRPLPGGKPSGGCLQRRFIPGGFLHCGEQGLQILSAAGVPGQCCHEPEDLSIYQDAEIWLISPQGEILLSTSDDFRG